MLNLVDSIKKKGFVRGKEHLPLRKLGASEVSMERVERLSKVNKKLTSLFEDFNLLLAKFGHFRPFVCKENNDSSFCKRVLIKLKEFGAFFQI